MSCFEIACEAVFGLRRQWPGLIAEKVGLKMIRGF